MITGASALAARSGQVVAGKRQRTSYCERKRQNRPGRRQRSADVGRRVVRIVMDGHPAKESLTMWIHGVVRLAVDDERILNLVPIGGGGEHALHREIGRWMGVAGVVLPVTNGHAFGRSRVLVHQHPIMPGQDGSKQYAGQPDERQTLAEPAGSNVGRPRNATLFRRCAKCGRFGFNVLSKRTQFLARLVDLLVDNFSARAASSSRTQTLRRVPFRLMAARLPHFQENRPRRGSGCPLLPTKHVWHTPQPRLPQSTIPQSARSSDRWQRQRNPLPSRRWGLARLSDRASRNRWAPLGNQRPRSHPEPYRTSNMRQRRRRSADHSSDNSTSASPK